MKFALIAFLTVATQAQKPVFGGQDERPAERPERPQQDDPWAKHPMGPPLPRGPYVDRRYDPYGPPDYGYGMPYDSYGMGGPYASPEELKFRQEQ